MQDIFIYLTQESYQTVAMNLNEVPQDGLNYKDRDKVHKLMYAVDKEGQYTGVTSAGWEAENVAILHLIGKDTDIDLC